MAKADESRLVGSGPFRAQNLAGGWGGGLLTWVGFLTWEIFYRFSLHSTGYRVLINLKVLKSNFFGVFMPAVGL
jgi:hypothetical protein